MLAKDTDESKHSKNGTTESTLYKGILLTAAPALQTARDTASIAFAPSFTKKMYIVNIGHHNMVDKQNN